MKHSEVSANVLRAMTVSLDLCAFLDLIFRWALPIGGQDGYWQPYPNIVLNGPNSRVLEKNSESSVIGPNPIPGSVTLTRGSDALIG